MRESELSFASRDTVSTIRAIVWEPESTEPDNTRGIIQILHGMAEHIERYRHFAEYCTEQGYIVCGHDHIGHGKSVSTPEQKGILPPDGMPILIEDAHQLRQLIQERYQSDIAQSSLPYFMFGHSMGSFVLRNYLALYAEGVAGAIICGTGHQPALISALGRFIARAIGAIRGVGHRSSLLHNMSVGAFSKQVDNARTPVDWISADVAIVDEYLADPDCGFVFGAGGNATLTALTSTMVRRDTAEAVPKDLPLYFISGEDDPVGEKGVAVKRAVELFLDTGHTDVTLKLYPHMRHEILNEIGKEQVYQDIVEWIQSIDVPSR